MAFVCIIGMVTEEELKQLEESDGTAVFDNYGVESCLLVSSPEEVRKLIDMGGDEPVVIFEMPLDTEKIIEQIPPGERLRSLVQQFLQTASYSMRQKALKEKALRKKGSAS